MFFLLYTGPACQQNMKYRLYIHEISERDLKKSELMEFF